jgi:hypothetical protein
MGEVFALLYLATSITALPIVWISFSAGIVSRWVLYYWILFSIPALVLFILAGGKAYAAMLKEIL